MFIKAIQRNLPLKYAILCGIGGAMAILIGNLLGLNHGGATYTGTAIATSVGGAIGGLLQQRKIRKSEKKIE